MHNAAGKSVEFGEMIAYSQRRRQPFIPLGEAGASAYPAGALVRGGISDEMVLRTSGRFHLELFGG
jgi:hypothetical protein